MLDERPSAQRNAREFRHVLADPARAKKRLRFPKDSAEEHLLQPGLFFTFKDGRNISWLSLMD